MSDRPPLPEIVAKLIPRLASNHDGEVIAMRAIDRTLKADRLDWHDLTRALTAGPPQRSGYSPPRRAESAEATQMRVWLETVSREPWPNDWTQKFMAGVLARQSLDRLSKKQVACANIIVAEAYRRGVRVDRGGGMTSQLKSWAAALGGDRYAPMLHVVERR
jgi:hypothetical protein